ncbi:hypothetical protein NEUTE1DRAFT_100290 [Neurospora tetrasperma FGSC 2508]|uniref:Uncharacterized protein n=1 Tax=Neurospora tetrasperma (strain FGSC 2508 / ATCC MYA-4615 / P0657) TaxID=510951 RepID=F8MK73_NEUT8|nr:uncharacterized protein NEUTE1DRAFT_100290 [Neurospora tetrasperma FGSC 2508]EGO57357.1 hypothetical protein NEUTE1DRAFT_100290 [Neurospora tetrasperma FGSC 2508]EGZ72390.1 hypothetical protein NEUTE2DRAFT_129754 [Neurospora tetrasperma FGSC 2509]
MTVAVGDHRSQVVRSGARMAPNSRQDEMKPAIEFDRLHAKIIFLPVTVSELGRREAPAAPRMTSVTHGPCTLLCTLSGYACWWHDGDSHTQIDG